MKDRPKMRAFSKGCYFRSQMVSSPCGLFMSSETSSRCFHLSVGERPEDAGAALGALESRGHSSNPSQAP